MQKRTFLLFEILIAFSLVTLCIVPLIKQPLAAYKNEIDYLEKMERERLADWTFTEIKEILLKNEIPWEKIPEMGSKSSFFPLPPVTVEIPGCKPKKIERSFTLYAKGEKSYRADKKNGEADESAPPSNGAYRQLWIHIWFNKDQKDKTTYQFRLPVQKK